MNPPAVQAPVESQGLFDLQNQVATLEQEIKRLHGEIEEQSHRLDQLDKRQHDVGTGADQRLGTLEGGGMATAPSPPVEQPPLETIEPGAPGRDNEWTIVEEEGKAPALAIENESAPSGTSAPAQSPQPASPAPPGASAPAQSPATVAMAQPVGEREAYQQAFELLKTGRYDEALGSFKDFLGRYPTGPYADNAQYWLGETYYVRRQFDPAIAEYEKLVQHYPQSQKLSHALLKIGYSYYELGQIDKARATLQEIRNRYPDTAAARLAQERLERIQREHP
jgi:tol-pal system protein YbgF